MSLRLDIRPCWKWECPHCSRVFRYPTTRSMAIVGEEAIEQHLETAHGQMLSEEDRALLALTWERDHMAMLKEPSN